MSAASDALAGPGMPAPGGRAAGSGVPAASGLGGRDLAGRRQAWAAARAALAGLEGVLWQASGAELGPVLKEVADLVRLGEAARVAVVGEAMSRGEMRSDTGPTPPGADAAGGDGAGADAAGGGAAGADGAGGGDAGADLAGGGAAGAGGAGRGWGGVAVGLVGVGWVREWAAGLRAGGSARLVRLVERLRSGSHAQLRAAVLDGRVGVGKAAVCVAEMDRLIPRLCPQAVPTVWEALIGLAGRWGPREIRAVRPRLLAEYGAAGQLQGEQDAAARRVALSWPYDGGDGTFD